MYSHSVAIAAPWEIAKDKVQRQLHYDIALASVDSDRDVSVKTRTCLDGVTMFSGSRKATVPALS